MSYNSHQHLRQNIDALKIALTWKSGDILSPEQVKVLKAYSGFGGIKAILFPNAKKEEWIKLNASKEDLKLHPQIIALHELLQQHLNEAEYKQTIDTLKNSILTAFYTPEIIPRTLFDTLKHQGIKPKNIYEPSSGAGVFVSEAATAFPALENITAVEKDILSGRVLTALGSSIPVPIAVQVKAFEETSNNENGKFDCIVSNIPFGNFQVFDPTLAFKEGTDKIHNYFFSKGLDKIKEGGLLAYVTTDSFLNTPSNQTIREYLFANADFVALNVLPDNLMKDTGNTEAPSHLLVVQKNSNKNNLSAEEILLTRTTEKENEFGKYSLNQYIDQHPEIIAGDEIKAGQNQYGKAAQTIWQHGDINGIGEKIETEITRGIVHRFNRELFNTSALQLNNDARKLLTYLPMPENKADGSVHQLGLFDTGPAENINRAIAYIHAADATVIDKRTARLLAIVRTEDNLDHESIVLIAAKAQDFKGFAYKLYSNLEEIQFPANWMSAAGLQHQLRALPKHLQQYEHSFFAEGEGKFMITLDTKLPQLSNVNPYYKEGTLIVHDQRVGFVSYSASDNDRPVFLPSLNDRKDIGFYQQYTALRDSYLLLADKEATENTEYPALRKDLNESYDAMVKGFGMLNASTNRQRILKDEAFGFLVLASLERKEGNQYLKSDILTQSLIEKKIAFHTENPTEALAKSLNDKGTVDLDFIAAAIGSTKEEAIVQLGDHIFINPINTKWETADLFLSGNVVNKLRLTQDALLQHPDNLQLQRSLSALEKIQPERIPFELLDFNLGERWIPAEYYNQFATALFETNTTVNYFSSLDIFKVKADSGNAKTNQEYAVTTKSGSTTYGPVILEHALENTTPFYTYEVDMGGKKIRVADNEAIQLAHGKIESIRNHFTEWLNQLPSDDKKTIEALYNDTFNCYVLREYNGNHLQFPGLDKQRLGIEDLYSSQKSSVWRVVQNRGALIDHEVGLGKTLTMIVAAHEMKRLQIVNKPMILALKANVDQIKETYQKAYPKARILAPGENDFTPAKRVRLFHEIKNNNWDCIILTHDQFGKIPQSPDIQKQIFETELDNVERDLHTVKSLGGEVSRRMLKGLEIRKSNLAIKLLSLAKDIESKKDEDINFRSLGVDHLFVDESHKYKNLTFTTRHERVAGLGNLAGSQKALNMLFAVRELQTKFDADLCVTFLSGTPISNSLTEMYLLFKYLRPKEMKRQQIENFDAWAAVFAKKTVDFEFSVTNEIIAKERFRHFIKVPELALFYNEITDYKTAQHINLDKPELDEHLINIKPTPDQQAFIKNLMAFAKTGDAELIGRSKLTPEEDKGRMLIATNYAKKMAADMRLIDPFKYKDHPNSKVNVCAAKLVELYHQSTAHKGTQIVFSDIGTPKPDEFNIYDALKENLINQYNIPASQISFIHDWTDRQKPELFRKMNAGEIRFLFGSTEKAGTGLNVQQRIVGMHHLDIPWKPSELVQRSGRGGRQGNFIAKEFYDNKVKNYIYAVEQSLDNYKFNLLKNKQTFISQMKNCSLNVRTIDEGSIDEKSGMNFSEYIAILSGDTSLLEKSKMEKKIAVLESLRSAHHKESVRAGFQLEHLQKEAASTKDFLDKLIHDENSYKKQQSFEPDGSKSNPIKLQGHQLADAEAIGIRLIQLNAAWKPETPIKDDEMIGSLYGFNLMIRRQSEALEDNGRLMYRYYNTFYAESPKTQVKYSWNQGHINTDNPKIAARYFLNAIDRVEGLKEKYQKNLAELEQNIPMLKNLIAKPFEKETELAELKKSVSALEREITIKIQENQMKQANGNNTEHKETPVIKMEGTEKKKGKGLLVRKEPEKKKKQSLRV